MTFYITAVVVAVIVGICLCRYDSFSVYFMYT